MDEALLIDYDGFNMPYVLFKNQIINLMERCPYPDRKLPLLRAACVRAAAHTIAVVISDTPGFDDEAKISMAFDRLSQRFGVRGGFVNKPEIRQIRNGPKMTSTLAAAWKTFKDELTQYFVFAHSYKKPELLEGPLVVDLSRRLPTYAKQRFYFLSDRFGSLGDSSFGSLLEFVEREEDSKSSDFGVQLMADEKSERTLKRSATCRGNPSFNVKKTSAQFDGNGCRNNDGNFQNGNMIPARAKPFSDSKNIDLVSVAPQCFVCVMEGLDSRHKVANCQRFRRMNPSERKDVVFKARQCFNCLGAHLVKDCTQRCDCRRCQGSDICKHFFMLHEYSAPTVPKSFGNNERVDREENDDRNPSVAQGPSFPVRSVKIGLTKAALNRIVATRVVNPQTGKSKLVYCQQDGGSQLTIISNKLVEELNLEPYDQASFRIETMTEAMLTHWDLVRFNLQSSFSDETFALSNVVTHSPWRDDMNTLPHRQDMSTFAHFKDVELFELPENKTIDLLIENDNAFLITVLEERVGALRSDPHAVLTPLGWLGCGGKSPLEESPVKVCRVHACVNMTASVAECPEIVARDNRIRELEQALKDVTLQDAEIDCS